MSQDNPVLSVPFQGATLSLIDRDGEPFVAMRPIVEAIGLDWKSQHVKITSRYESVVVEITTVAEDGKQRAMTCLPLRKLAGWLMTIHPSKVRAALRETIRAYQNECDDALWAYWTQGQATRPAAQIRTETPAARRALPAPADPITRQVRAAIHRKAHALGADAFEHNCQIIEDWLRRQPDLYQGKHCIVDLQTVADMVSWGASLARTAELFTASVTRLEAQTRAAARVKAAWKAGAS